MSATCERIVRVDDDYRRPIPWPVECGAGAVAEVSAPYGREPWCACDEHAREAERDGANVERWL